jgi:hypothetical protein
MATITGEVSFKTMWNLDRDVGDIVTTIENAITASKGVGTVFFIGETHKIGFDLDRRHRVYAHFVGDERVTIMLERGMNEVRQGNVMQENNFFESGSDARNEQVVMYLNNELTPATQARPILVFFGQEHEPRIKQLIAQTFPATMRLRWVLVPTMGDFVANEPTTAFNPAGLLPAGYVDCIQARLDYRLGLLKKGIVHEPFNLELVRTDCAMEALVWAVYFTDQAINGALRAEVSAEGTTAANFVRINGVHRAFAVLLLRRHIPHAESGALAGFISNDYF